jgi:hypothetical protein
MVQQVKTTDLFSVASGTHLQGYVNTTYDNLVALFGNSLGSGDKTTQEWILEFDDGTVATIYDWKEYDTPMGRYDWHIGGTSKQAVALVNDALAGFIEVVDAFDVEA